MDMSPEEIRGALSSADPRVKKAVSLLAGAIERATGKPAGIEELMQGDNLDKAIESIRNNIDMGKLNLDLLSAAFMALQAFGLMYTIRPPKEKDGGAGYSAIMNFDR